MLFRSCPVFFDESGGIWSKTEKGPYGSACLTPCPEFQYLAEEHGLAVVPGVYFSPFGGEWIRFSYATPPERTIGAARRLLEGLDALVS